MSVDSRLRDLWQEGQGQPYQQDKPTYDPKAPSADLSKQGEIGVFENQPTTDQEKHHAAEREYWQRELRLTKWQNWITIIVAIVGVFVGLLNLWLIWGTLRVTQIAADAAWTQAQTAQGQLEEMRSSSADTKAVADAAQRSAAVAQQALVATQEVVEASRIQAEAARQQTETARQALSSTNEISQMERRAWVSVVEYKAFMNGGIGDWWWFEVAIKNDGPTPALNVRSIAEVRAFPRTKKFSPIYRGKGVGQGGVLSPGFRPDLTTTPTVLTQELSEALKDGSSVLYVYGRILYDDIFRHSHRTTFCMYFPTHNPSAEAPFVPCPTYNEAD